MMDPAGPFVGLALASLGVGLDESRNPKIFFLPVIRRVLSRSGDGRSRQARSFPLVLSCSDDLDRLANSVSRSAGSRLTIQEGIVPRPASSRPWGFSS